MEQAQEITDKAFSEILTRIRVGMTEKRALCGADLLPVQKRRRRVVL